MDWIKGLYLNGSSAATDCSSMLSKGYPCLLSNSVLETMERVDMSTMSSRVFILSRKTTKARRGRGGGVLVGFDCHERTVDFSGSSRPTYWKLRF